MANSFSFIDSERSKSKLKLFIAFSLVFHIVILSTFKSKQMVISTKKLNDKIIPIRIKLQKPKVSRQVVQTELNHLDLKKKKKKRIFLGKKNNYVERETVAKKIGKFKSAAKGSRGGSKVKQTKKLKNIKKLTKKLKFSDFALAKSYKEIAKKEKKSLKRSSALGLKNGNSKQAGLGKTNDFIKDIKLGDFTKLNTQEFAFYGFYHRIRQKLEQFWGANIKEQAQKILKSGRSIATDSNHLTSLVINLNNKGEITKVKIKSSSGVKELDKAAVRSFNQAGPFPNPPKKMLKNGIVVLEWGFVVNT